MSWKLTSIEVGRNSAFIILLPKYEATDRAMIDACDAIMPTLAPLPFANGINMARMKTPIKVPLVAAFTNIEISMTPENMLTMYAKPMQINAYVTPSVLIAHNCLKSANLRNIGICEMKSSQVTVATEFSVDT